MAKKNFVAGILDRKAMVILVMILVFVGGLLCYYTVPKQRFPKVVVPAAAVSVVYPGATAEELEELVAKPVEKKCMELTGYENCTTSISQNVCTTTVVLSMYISQDEVDDAWDDLRLKMNALQSELPSGVSYIQVDDDIMDVAGVIVAVTGDQVSNDELNQRTNELADNLRDVDGVSKVSISGDVTSEIKVVVDSKKLNNQSVSMAELATLISAHNTVVPSGSIDVDGNKISVDTSNRFTSVDEIGNVVIGASDSGVITRLKDIATITTAVPDDEAYYLYDGQKSDVIAVYFDEDVNAVSLSDALTETIDDYSATLPEGISANTVYFQPTDVSKSVNDFIINLLESIVLVIIVILIGMDLKNAFVISFAMPLAILGNFIVMKVCGLDIHFVSLAGLMVVLGMLVDNAVVVSDAIQVKLDEGLDRREAVIEGTAGVITPVFVSMLTTCAAFASLFTLPGAYKQLAFTFPAVIITCLVLSFLVSVMITPLMCYFFLRKKKIRVKKDGTVKSNENFLIRGYNKVSAWTFNHKAITFGVSFLVIIAGLLSVTQLGMEVVPKAGKDYVTITVNGTNDSSLSKTREVVDNVEKILKEQPETVYYLSGVGKAIPRYDYSTRPLGQGNSLGDIALKIDVSKSDRFKDTSEMVDYLQDELSANVGGATFNVDELGIMALTAKPVEVKLYSDNLDDLNTAAQMVNDMLASMPGAKGIVNDNEVNTYNYYVDMDDLKLNTLGLTKAEAENELSYALLGRTVSQYKNGNKEYDIVLDSDVNSREQIQSFKVKSSTSGSKYDVSQFANVDLEPKITTITRANGRRGRVVNCFNSTKYSSIEMQNELSTMLEEADLPDTVTVEETGERKDYYEVLGHIGRAAAVSFIIMLLLLMMQFGKFKQVLIVFTSIPFGLCAGFVSLYVTGEKMALFALLGSVSLLGCVLANAIVLVEYINEELASGLPLEEACRSAGGKRVVPIMMSTMTTVLGLLPLALFGDALFVPMAVLMMAGLTVSMCINLVLVPMIYYLSYKKKYKKLEQQQ